MKTPFLSFIIPVYNAGQYLIECIGSVMRAIDTGKIPAELIIIDDGSTDGSGVYCDKVEKKVPYIKVVHQENQGQCAARNTGIKMACGKWICFVDHDDTVSENICRRIYELNTQNEDIVYFGFQNIYKNGKKETCRKSIEPIVFQSQEIEKLQWDCLCRYRNNKPLIGYILTTVPWAKVYSRRFLVDNGFLFPEGYGNLREEDIAFNLQCLSAVRRASYVEPVLYYHRVIENSEGLSYKPNCMEMVTNTQVVFHEIIERLYGNDPRMKELLEFRLFWDLLYCVILDPAHPKNPKPYHTRKMEYLRIINDKTMSSSIKKINVNNLPFLHWVLAQLVINKHFRLISLLNHIRYSYSKLF